MRKFILSFSSNIVKHFWNHKHVVGPCVGKWTFGEPSQEVNVAIMFWISRFLYWNRFQCIAVPWLKMSSSAMMIIMIMSPLVLASTKEKFNTHKLNYFVFTIFLLLAPNNYIILICKDFVRFTIHFTIESVLFKQFLNMLSNFTLILSISILYKTCLGMALKVSAWYLDHD